MYYTQSNIKNRNSSGKLGFRFVLHIKVFVGFDAVEEEVHFIDALIDMPMTAVPHFVVGRFFDGIEPAFGAIVHGALINAGEKGFNGLVITSKSFSLICCST